MTCIVGLEHEGAVYLGGDSYAGDGYGYNSLELAESKVFCRSGIAMGVAGNPRVAQLLAYGLRVPAHRRDVSDMVYLTMHFASAIEDLLQKHQVRLTIDQGPWYGPESKGLGDSHALLGYRGRLYNIVTDMAIDRETTGYSAVGSASSYALGAMHATAGRVLDPKERITTALRAAAQHSSIVRPPFTFVCLGS